MRDYLPKKEEKKRDERLLSIESHGAQESKGHTEESDTIAKSRTHTFDPSVSHY